MKYKLAFGKLENRKISEEGNEARDESGGMKSAGTILSEGAGCRKKKHTHRNLRHQGSLIYLNPFLSLPRDLVVLISISKQG